MSTNECCGVSLVDARFPEGSVEGDTEVGVAFARACFEGWPEVVVQAAPTFASGDILAKRYVVEQLLARGGMGEVYVAFDKLLEQRVAIKTILSTLSDDPAAIRRLCREVSLGRRVRHPNVCRVHDIGVHRDDPRDTVFFMTMDFVEGRSLKLCAREQPLAIAHAVRITRQILLGLDAVHSAGVLHRDLKSDNIVISGTGDATRAVLVDFGLSCELDSKRCAAGAPTSGSIGYMAPEQLEGKELSPRTDIFACGVVFFEMLTGSLPFERRGAEVVRATRQWRAGSPSTLRPEVPPALDAVVDRCLQESPEARYPDAQSALRALDPFAPRTACPRFAPGPQACRDEV